MRNSDSSLSQESDLLKYLGVQGFIHLWGASGSGKTLLAMQAAAIKSRNSHVIWICTDFKVNFIQRLRDLVALYNGNSSNIVIILTKGSSETYDAITNLKSEIDDTTSLVIIDTITRVLDMARRDPLLWGREMVEDVLPYLAGLVTSRKISILCTSECRTLDSEGPKPVFHDALRKWVDIDLQLLRPHGSYRTEINDTINNTQIAIQVLKSDGLPKVTRLAISESIKGVSKCSEEQSFV